MAESSAPPAAASLPVAGTAEERAKNPVRDRLLRAKRDAVDTAMGKADSWATKVVNGESGVRLEDLPRLLDTLGLKVVDKAKKCVDAELARAYEVIVARATQARQLLEEDAE